MTRLTDPKLWPSSLPTGDASVMRLHRILCTQCSALWASPCASSISRPASADQQWRPLCPRGGLAAPAVMDGSVRFLPTSFQQLDRHPLRGSQLIFTSPQPASHEFQNCNSRAAVAAPWLTETARDPRRVTCDPFQAHNVVPVTTPSAMSTARNRAAPCAQSLTPAAGPLVVGRRPLIDMSKSIRDLSRYLAPRSLLLSSVETRSKSRSPSRTRS